MLGFNSSRDSGLCLAMPQKSRNTSVWPAALLVICLGGIGYYYSLSETPIEPESRLSQILKEHDAVRVAQYSKANGTVVDEHGRTRSNGTTVDNWSSFPNVNPITGELGRLGSRAVMIQDLSKSQQNLLLSKIDSVLVPLGIEIDRTNKEISAPQEFWNKCETSFRGWVSFQELTQAQKIAIETEINNILRPHKIQTYASGKVIVPEKLWREVVSLATL